MRARFSPLFVLAVLIALLIALPIISLAFNLFAGGTSETWAHLSATVLPDYIINTGYLCLGVALGVALLGTGSAWLVALHDFPGKRVFEWALLLPLAMPAYVMAYVYTDFLQFVGPLQTSLRETMDWQKGDYWFPDVRTLGGAIAMFILALYPYVYLLTRTAFLEQAAGMSEAARVLGCSAWGAFRRVSLPLARPAIAAGVALALMETLADYGTVAYFSVQTFTTGIYRAWFSLGDHAAAAQLAVLLLGFVLLLLTLEKLSRGRARFHDTSRRRGATVRRLHGMPAILAVLACALPLTMGFLLPAVLLARLALGEIEGDFASRFLILARNSLVLALLAALSAAVLALLLAYVARRTARQAGSPQGQWSAGVSRWVNRLVSLGYAVPGSVIAVGVLIPVTRFDRLIGDFWQQLSGTHPGLLLTGGIAALLYAYLVRFLSIALQTVEAGLGRITLNMDDAARSLGYGQLATLWCVHFPLMRGSLLTATLLVFVDVMKELPATLVMRPFNFDTLATQTYTLAADERLAEAAIVALAIVAVGLVPLAILARQIARGKKAEVQC